MAFLMAPFLSNAQNFEKYTDMEGVSVVLVTSEMFKLLSDIDFESEDPETQAYVNLIENLENIRVISTTDSGIGSKMSADAKSYLNSSGMKMLMSIKDDGQDVKFYIRPGSSEDYVKELFMFMQGEENGKPMTTIMRITGNVDLKQISKLAKDLDVQGAGELEKIDEK
jgi:hypothetical protein